MLAGSQAQPPVIEEGREANDKGLGATKCDCMDNRRWAGLANNIVQAAVV